MVCVMGASGSGKSTLLKVLGGQIQPTAGDVLLNGQSLYENLDELKRYVSYIPQEDAFDEHLTIGENLQFAAAIRSPHLSRRDRTRRIESKLVELGLSERRDSVVGSPVKKTLSGGERKRLNIGLDMIGSPTFTSSTSRRRGLSSKDSEHVIEIIRAMAHNKIILVTIHQPSSKIFQMFHKAILLDKGGTPRLLRHADTTCCATSRRRSISINSARNSAPARPAARRGRNSFSTSSRRRCATSAATSFTRRTIAGQLVAGAALLARILAR